MKKNELNNEENEDECIVDDESSNGASAKLPYSTKQFINCVYSNKGKVHSHHLPYFRIESENDNWESLFSSFYEKDFLYLSHKEVWRLNVNLIDFVGSNTVKYQRVKREQQTTLKSFSNLKNKSSREILKDMLL